MTARRDKRPGLRRPLHQDHRYGRGQRLEFTAVQSTASSRSRLGVFRPVLGFFPALPSISKNRNCSTVLTFVPRLPQAGGMLQHFSCLQMPRLDLIRCTKDFLPSDGQTMPASSSGRVGEASCTAVHTSSCKQYSVCLQTSVDQHQHSINTSSLDEAS